jgi:hypothetical protein
MTRESLTRKTSANVSKIRTETLARMQRIEMHSKIRE